MSATKSRKRALEIINLVVGLVKVHNGKPLWQRDRELLDKLNLEASELELATSYSLPEGPHFFGPLLVPRNPPTERKFIVFALDSWLEAMDDLALQVEKHWREEKPETPISKSRLLEAIGRAICAEGYRLGEPDPIDQAMGRLGKIEGRTWELAEKLPGYNHRPRGPIPSARPPGPGPRPGRRQRRGGPAALALAVTWRPVASGPPGWFPSLSWSAGSGWSGTNG
jgi:hypothetical protein